MPHRRLHPNPYLIVNPFETFPERFNTAHHEFPRHMTDVSPFTLPNGADILLLERIREFAQRTRPFSVTFDSPETWEYDGVEHHVQRAAEGRLQAIELHLGLLSIIGELGGTVVDMATAGIHYTPHTNLMKNRAPYSLGQQVPIRTLMVVGKYPKGYAPVGEHAQTTDAAYKTITQGYRLLGGNDTIT